MSGEYRRKIAAAKLLGCNFNEVPEKWYKSRYIPRVWDKNKRKYVKKPLN